MGIAPILSRFQRTKTKGDSVTEQFFRVMVEIRYQFEETKPREFEIVIDKEHLENLLGRYIIKHGPPVEHKCKGGKLYEFYSRNHKGWVESTVLYTNATAQEYMDFKTKASGVAVKAQPEVEPEPKQITALVEAGVVRAS